MADDLKLTGAVKTFKKGTFVFPTEYDPGSPFVHFFSKQYEYATSSSKEAKVGQKAEPSTKISMYMPGGFSESLGNSWDRQAIIGGGREKINDAAALAASEALSNFVGGKIAGTVKAYFGVAVQPTDMMVFNGIDPIKTNFKFNIIPSSKEESLEIRKIVRTFKNSMLPKHNQDSTLALLKYPKVWDIHFTGVAGMGVEFQNKYMDMALTSCNISYNHGENFLVYNSDNSPVELSIDLSFESIRRPTQDNEEFTEDFGPVKSALGAVYDTIKNLTSGQPKQ